MGTEQQGNNVARLRPAAAEGGGCQRCFGTGLEIVPGRGARRCECRNATAAERLLEQSRIPRRYSRCALSNYYPAGGNGTQYAAHSYAKTLVKEYPAVDRGLLLMGPCGVGKTHLAVAVSRGLIARGVPCLFYEMGALLKEIQNSYNPVSQTTEASVLAPLTSVEVLVLDELGGPNPTDWVRDTVYQIVNTRYNEERMTIFTTNYQDERLAPAGATLEERIGTRLRSRLYEMCREVSITGDDYRVKLARRLPPQQAE